MHFVRRASFHSVALATKDEVHPLTEMLEAPLARGMIIIRISILFLALSFSTLNVFACERDAECDNDQICNDNGQCVSDGRDWSSLTEFGVTKDKNSLKNVKTFSAGTEKSTEAEALTSICGCLEWVRHDAPYNIFRGTANRTVYAVGPGGTWTTVHVRHGHTYRQGLNWGWSCSRPR